MLLTSCRIFFYIFTSTTCVLWYGVCTCFFKIGQSPIPKFQNICKGQRAKLDLQTRFQVQFDMGKFILKYLVYLMIMLKMMKYGECVSLYMYATFLFLLQGGLLPHPMCTILENHYSHVLKNKLYVAIFLCNMTRTSH